MLSKRDQQIKTLLDTLVVAHKTPDFVAGDPVSIPHRFRDDKKACELVAFLTALFTYGQRPKIIALLDDLLLKMDNDPVAFAENFNPQRDGKLFKNFVYRFNTADDLVFLLARLQHAYREYQTLENLFAENKKPDLRESIAGFLDAFTGKKLHESPAFSNGLKFLFAHPKHGGPCKRFNLFLRWAVRPDATDLNLWHTALKPSELIIPLDTHVSKCNRLLGFSSRRSPDWQLAEEITQALRRYHREDPMQYDYALMGLGLALNEAGYRNGKRVSLKHLLFKAPQVYNGLWPHPTTVLTECIAAPNCVLPAAAIS